MATKKESITYFSLMNDIKAHKFVPIYVLHGEEAYYIDQLQEAIVDNALSEDEKAFNLTITYGVDVADVKQLISVCKQYPAMSQYQVVVLREAQNLGKLNNKGNANELNLFKFYAQSPLKSTILVICFKGGQIKAKEFTDAIKKYNCGIVFESVKLRDGRPVEIAAINYAKAAGCGIDEKAASMLATNIGNDVSRLFGEIDKLRLLAGENGVITPELVEKNIGISKDYNYWELEDAIINKNATKAFRIVDYFEKKSKNSTDVIITIGNLFSFFTGVLMVNTAKDKSPSGLMAATGNKSPFRIRKFESAARQYSTVACVNIISYLRQCDVGSKGIESRQGAFKLLKELIFKILNSR